MPTISGIIFADNDGNGKYTPPGDQPASRPLTVDVVVNGSVVETLHTTSASEGSYLVPTSISLRVRRDSYPSGYKCSTDAGKGYQEYFLSNVTSADIGSMPIAPPLPPTPPVQPAPSRPAHIGAVAWSSQVGNLATIQKLKPFGIRYFAQAIQKGGNFNGNDLKTFAPLVATGIKAVSCYSPPESDPGNTDLSTANLTKYFTAVANVGGGKPGYILEGPNEINNPKYLPMGQSMTTPDAKTVAQVVTIHQIMRETNPSATIYSSSIGYNASPQPHIDYITDLVNAGMLKYVDAINTHFYFTDPKDVELVLSTIRKLVGPTFPIVLTEVNFQVPENQYAATAAKILPIIAKYNAIPFVYRLCPTGSSALDSLGLLDANGNVNTVIAKAWGLV